MTSGGGRGSSPGRGSRELSATRGGWAPFAPPREAPACLGPRPLRARRARLRRVAAAAAAAMSPGKPGAGGAGTRRTGWRRRRRRRRLEAETRAPGFGHTAGRVPGTFQGAQGMKPAARETRTPPRSPGLRWALLPLLLLLRQGQVLCTGAAPNPVFDIEAVVSPTNVVLTWKHNDSATSECRIQNKMENKLNLTVKNQTSCSITGLSPATSYTFFITLETTNETLEKNITTEPLPVSDLRVAFLGVTQALLTWSNANGTASYRMLIEESASSVNVSGLKPGTHNISVFPESNKTQNDFPVAEDVLDANGTTRSPGANLSQPHETPLAPAQDPSLTEVLLTELKPYTHYNVTIYPQAADGTEGQPGKQEFETKSLEVSDIRAVNISFLSMTLTWKSNYDGSRTSLVYRIHVAGETSSINQTVNETEAIILGLSSSTLYNITVHPFLGQMEGRPGFLQVYTSPGPVSDFRVANVSMREIGLAWRSNDSESFEIFITQDGGGMHRNASTGNQSYVVEDLKPGTSYHFEIVPRGPDGTKGPPRTIDGRTDRSAVVGIHVVNVSTTELQLEWQNTDSASGYIYHLVLESKNGSIRTNSSQKWITVGDLTPGTLYNVTIFPEVDQIQGDSNSITQYTRPSSVSHIEVNTTTTAATIRWKNEDAASASYVYSVLILKTGDGSSVTSEVTGIPSVTVTTLLPGVSYTVKILTQVGNDTVSLVPGWQLFCMEPAPVAFFHCEVVPKEPALVLKWACPPGVNTGFELGVRSDAWDNMTRLENCTSDDDTECRTEVTYLNFSTSYNISIATLSCGKTALPTQSTCTTSITDPPPPDGSPNITSVSHNSVKVKFSGFEASHGPIKAYAVILTTGEAGQPSADVLKYTYEDFKRGASDTYVTYLIRIEEKGRSPGLSEVLNYEIDVGNQSTTLGYYNGRLEPLGSYRACVAGFTNIIYNLQNDGLINGDESYVSFSRYSEAVFLPQDPGVICGAVFGCIFGALAIMAVGGFIFWRKKRTGAKNNEVSFSQIKPKKSKLIRVENFEAYFKKQQADSNCGFAEEYEDLKLIGISLPKYTAEIAENRGKNRYNNVLPYDISRVKLSVQTHSTDDYINANYMPGYHSKKDFIATQGPLPNTLKDFWRMVWEKNVYAIVMLTKCVEQGRTKCEEYWPSKQAHDYGDITVAMTSEVVLPEWTIRDFVVKNMQNSESHPLRQFHFTSWPDHGVPDTTDLLINFRYLVRDYMKQIPPESPILVHCSAGVGRTGTFIAIDRLIYQIENENTVDVYGIVYDLRMHRPLMVQTEDQYVFLNQCVLDIIRAQKDSKVDLIYQNTTAMTIYENLEPVSMFGKTNGYIA
ncbi:receptor-type tyrosine-protein phosphatase eta [Apodemus sylvaticus]|uniref:receptor-type tyrosine-protein phosphatase eta n=1 Tax=Apodemus sylvaticus TaxID=10129 RepID=UPI002243973C|nr:receptor-type tyrosine-protein phosphatase eta [Apodemus sylvaticus]